MAACGAPPRADSGAPTGAKPTSPAIQLWFAGDVHLGTPAANAAMAGPRWPGVGIINLEGPIAAERPVGDGVRLANGLATPAHLVAAGVGVVGLANNHMHDAGDDGLRSTAKLLEISGLALAGPKVATTTIGRRRVAVAQFNLGAVAPDLSALLKAPAELRVATFHVTGPPSYIPPPRLRAAVEAAVAAGVDVVAAHGTHAIGPVERRGQQVIAWGLGNYVFSCECTREDEGLVLTIEASANQLRAWVHPIRAGLDGAPAQSAPDAAEIYELLQSLGSTALRPDGQRAEF